jgi:ribosomal protein L37AE/L43A
MLSQKQLPEGKTYACPKCSKPMFKQKGFAIYWCQACDFVHDMWYDEPPPIIDKDG